MNITGGSGAQSEDGEKTILTLHKGDGSQVSMGAIDKGYHVDVHAYKADVTAGQKLTATVQFYGADNGVHMVGAVLTALGIKR